ncbi:MAG TPA: single-stranded DNA-binding protein, partial [Bacteroidia bacterium]|nr:single-stranded DNA-binding protein [Bacteroidia bacterium]
KAERTTYVRCAMWRENTSIAQYITKGTKLYVEGSPDADAYVNKEGKAIGNLKVNVREIEFLGSATKKSESGSGAPAEDVFAPSANDDLPF